MSGARAVQRFWDGWKVACLAFPATWQVCPQSAVAGSAVILPAATSWLKSAYPQPPVIGNRLLSFSMTKACVGASGTSTAKVASVLFLKLHWSFAILEPSGNGWPLPGTPALYALIMVGLATITLSTSSVRAEETTDQSSYPLKSENAIPLGDFNEYLSCA